MNRSLFTEAQCLDLAKIAMAVFAVNSELGRNSIKRTGAQNLGDIILSGVPTGDLRRIREDNEQTPIAVPLPLS